MSQGTQSHSNTITIFEGPEGKVLLDTVDSMYVASFEFDGGFSLDEVRRYQEIMLSIEVAMKSFGISEYHVLVASQKDYDFAVWMGYTPCNKITEDGRFEILRKVI